jgi:hypothetical protein
LKHLWHMQGSDDYFDEELVLNDEDLAVLDEEEQKYARAITQTRPLVPPPTKRQKTEGGWRPGHESYQVEDLEDLPEISVQGDGTYGIGGASLGNTSRLTPAQEPTMIVQPSRLTRGNSRISSGSSSPIPLSVHVERILPPQTIRPGSSRSHQSIHVRPPTQEQRPSPSPSDLRPAQLQFQHAAGLALQHVPEPGVLKPQQIEAEIEALRRHMEEVCLNVFISSQFTNSAFLSSFRKRT